MLPYLYIGGHGGAKNKKNKIWVVVLSYLYIGAYDAMNNSLLFSFKGVSKVASYLRE